MDELDQKILQILIKSARTPFSRIGKMCGVSQAVVKQRYKKIKLRNPNLKSTVILDPTKIGFNSFATFSIKLIKEDYIQKVKSILYNYPRLVYLVELIGDFDFSFIIYIEKFEDFCETIEFLEKIKEIKEIDIALSRKNDTYCAPELTELVILEIE